MTLGQNQQESRDLLDSRARGALLLALQLLRGQRQPKMFLVNEPLSNLDAKLRIAMRFEIERLHQNLRATIVYVTHEQRRRFR